MQCYGVPRALPSSMAADGSWDVAVRRGEPLLCLLVAPAVSVGFPGRIISGSCPSVVRSRKALILILFSKKQDGGGQKMSSGEQNEWSIAWILFCSSFFFFLLLCMISVCAHQCMYNSSALGRGNWELQEAVAKSRESGGEVNASWLLLPSLTLPMRWWPFEGAALLCGAVTFHKILPFCLVGDQEAHQKFSLIWSSFCRTPQLLATA